MERTLKYITPLLIVGLWTFGTGIYVFTLDAGEEGWGYLAAIMICLFSLIPLGIDLVCRKVVKSKKKNLILQLPIALIIAMLYWKWDLIGF